MALRAVAATAAMLAVARWRRKRGLKAVVTDGIKEMEESARAAYIAEVRLEGVDTERCCTRWHEGG